MKRPPVQELRYEDGTKTWVFADDISLDNHYRVAAILQLARECVDAVLPTVNTENMQHLQQLYLVLDANTYGLVESHYSAIADLIGLDRVAELEPVSRYEFFIQTIVLGEEGLEPAPSGIDILMGANLSDDFDEEEDLGSVDIASSGDHLWDIETSIRMTFKHSAEGIISKKGLPSCIGMLRQAARHMKLAREQAEAESRNKKKGEVPKSMQTKAVKIERRALDDDYLKHKAEAFDLLDIDIPEDV